jgi:holo-[acyl-carrier protein] synthase
MIRGLGIDLVHVTRIRDVAERRGERFLKRLFTEGELAYCARHPEPSRHWAARFAAKEAAMKALGTGWNAGVSWRAIEVVNLPSGQPTLRLHGVALERARALGATATHITITHDGEFAQACVVLEGPEGDGAHGTGAALAAAIAGGSSLPAETDVD